MRIPSGVGGKFPTQKPAIDKVAEHIDDVVTVAESITSGQFDKVSVPEVKVVATSIKEVKQVAEVEQYVRMLAQDLSNIDLIGSQLAGVLNVSNNMAVVLLLHSRMADLLAIKKSLVHIDAVALNEGRINSVYEIIPEIATLVSHMDSLVRMAQVLPQLETVFENLDVILLIGSNVGHIVNVDTNMETILKASVYVDEFYTLIEQIKEREAHIIELEASSKVNAEEAAKQALEAKAQMVEATKQADISATQANAANSSATQAAGSASAADASQKKATTSEGNAKASEASAANSAAAALVSKNSAQAAIATVEGIKVDVVDTAATVAADKAVVVSTAATVATHRNEVASNTAKVATDKGLVEAAKIAAMNAATLAEAKAQVATAKAAEAAESAKTAGELATGVLQDAGSFESMGTLPQPPVAGGLKRSAMWKVTVAGTSGGIELAVGDTLVYTAGSDSYYKIDNTESVTSVQNRRGAVVITAADVGLGNVNNTDDSTKNVLSATKLTTARTINGISFDGTANITVADSTKVPTSRVVNGKALTDDIILNAADVGALPLTGGNVTGKIRHTYNTAVKVPSGTTEERGAGEEGDIRFNNTDKSFEGYDGSAWAPIGSNIIGYEVKDSPFLAEKNTGYMINTSAETITVTLPLVIKDSEFVIVGDYSGKADVHPIKIKGFNSDTLVLDKPNVMVQVTYLSGKWVVTDGIGESQLADIRPLVMNGTPVLSTAWVQLRTAMWLGYVPADGQLLNRELYPDAYTAIEAGLVPVCTDAEWLKDPSKRGCFTLGNGRTTFRVPDYNGFSEDSLGAMFQRGDGLNSAGVNGEIQGDAIRNITGTFAQATSTGAWLQNVTIGGVFRPINKPGGSRPANGGSVSTDDGFGVAFDASQVVPTAADNHPVNVTGCWAVKLFDAVKNIDQLDAAKLATELAVAQSKIAQLESWPRVVKMSDIFEGTSVWRAGDDEFNVIEYKDHYHIQGIFRTVSGGDDGGVLGSFKRNIKFSYAPCSVSQAPSGTNTYAYIERIWSDGVYGRPIGLTGRFTNSSWVMVSFMVIKEP